MNDATGTVRRVGQGFEPFTPPNRRGMFARRSTSARGNAPAVVMVHGLGLSGTYMLPLGRELADEFAVYAPDLPGFGRSAKPRRALTLPELGAALGDWLEDAGLTEVTLVGNSMGCQIIVETLAQRPERVARAVLQGPTTPPDERGWLIQFRRWRQNPNPTDMGDIASADYRSAGYARVLRTFQHSIRHRPEERLAGIAVPVLVVRGSRDPICHQGWADELTYRLPQGRFACLEGGYHTLVYTKPEELAALIRPFLRGEDTAQALRHAPQGLRKSPVASFDSASAMARLLGHTLAGRDFAALGLFPRYAEPLLSGAGGLFNRLPRPLRRTVYTRAGAFEGVPADRLWQVSSERLTRWAVDKYPRKRYPAIAIGSSNGALTYLYAAMGIPWLPQTLLLPVRRRALDIDDPAEELGWSRGPAARLLGANPELALHHMHDPNQDRLMIRRMSYFRVKLLRLTEAYRRFIRDHLEPGGTLYVVDCRLRWPAHAAGPRHWFQVGALGGAEAHDYYRCTERVERFLDGVGAGRRCWDGVRPTDEVPEAEWGFAPELEPDIRALADALGARVRRVAFDHPETPSPWAAELLRRWYREHGAPAHTLLLESFILMHPDLALRAAAVPYWSVFNAASSIARADDYLGSTEPYEAIRLALFNHGVESIGYGTADDWQALFHHARSDGDFLGGDPRRYPLDFASFVRSRQAARGLGRGPELPPLPLGVFESPGGGVSFEP